MTIKSDGQIPSTSEPGYTVKPGTVVECILGLTVMADGIIALFLLES
ncbi:MAG TPA: hypothetical protein VFD89_05005 [Clostridia bacterium]|nr:hypothetical protein [Clostridia bacterium]